MIETASKVEVPFATKTQSVSGAIWVALLFLAIPVMCLAVPMYVIRPFRPQDFSQLTAALTIRSLGPWLSAVSVVVVLALTIRVWRRSRQILPRTTITALLLLTILGAGLTNVNVFEVMFHPYPSPAFEDPASSKVEADDRVLAVTINGEARAYPIRTMGYHHIVNDTIGGTPLAVTYCTLCHTGLVWSRILNGKTLHFRLAGINNGNALMRDEETSSIWQQSTGEAIYGPWKGQHLTLIHSDEMTFTLWRSEQPTGQVLKPDAEYAAQYEPKDWEAHVLKTKTVIDTSRSGISPHELVFGVTIADTSKAYLLQTVLTAKLVQDKIDGRSVLLVVGPDGSSIRVFESTADTVSLTFLPVAAKAVGSTAIVMNDAETGSGWSFGGCAITGKLQGKCLQPRNGNKDYWFDWMNHHPGSQFFRA